MRLISDLFSELTPQYLAEITGHLILGSIFCGPNLKVNGKIRVFFNLTLIPNVKSTAASSRKMGVNKVVGEVNGKLIEISSSYFPYLIIGYESLSKPV